MNAVEYFKKHGYERCKSDCFHNGLLNIGFWVSLKEIVSAFNLVESHGGLEAARQEAHRDCFTYDKELLAACYLVNQCS